MIHASHQAHCFLNPRSCACAQSLGSTGTLAPASSILTSKKTQKIAHSLLHGLVPLGLRKLPEHAQPCHLNGSLLQYAVIVLERIQHTGRHYPPSANRLHTLRVV